MKLVLLKKIALAALVLSIFDLKAEMPEGFYGGPQVGVRVDDHVLSQTYPAGVFYYDLGSAMPVAGGTLGYQDHFYQSNWIWGLDFSTTYGRSKSSAQTPQGVGTLNAGEKTWDFTLALKFGYDAESVVPYVHGGFSFARFKTLVLNAPTVASHQTRSYKSGFVAGVGLSTFLCPGQELDFRYGYKRYGRQRGSAPSNANPVPHAVRLRSHEFFLTYKIFFEKDYNGSVDNVGCFPDGFIWGVNGGYQSNNTRLSQVSPGSALHTKLQGSTPFLGVSLGYQTMVSQFVLGADLRASYIFMGVKRPDSTGAFRALRQTWDSALLARIGYLLKKGLIPYVTAGFGYARFKASYNDLEILYGSAHKWRPGVVLGAGMQIVIDQADSLDLSYTYGRYKKLSFACPSTRAGVLATNNEFKPRTHRFMMSYRIKF
jgi:opacity protein-like surface antigen